MDDLFNIRIINLREGAITASLTVDREHPVYQGHFPGLPLTPGVCQLGMIRKILEQALGRSLQLMNSKNLKFTSMHDPRTQSVLSAEITFEQEGEYLKANASLAAGAETIFKFRGGYIEYR